MRLPVLSLGMILALSTSLVRAELPFDEQVAPILARCVSCHAGEDARAGLDLSRKARALAGGKNGAVIVPGESEKSLLWQRVVKGEMPPKKPLSAAEQKVLRAWIEAGAKWGSDPLINPSDRTWWSFQPLRKPALPAGTATHPIDRFIEAQLAQKHLSLSPPADRRTLLRRLKWDFLGLPPTPEEIAEFEQDRSPDAVEKRITALLASPHYGERSARFWLDLVRFAESHGFEMNQPRPNAWHYRDWVIASFNADLPYDQFIRAQLVGDQPGSEAGLGFLVAGPWDQVKSPDRTLTLNQRADELHDIVSTTTSTFLGLTVGCARCHNHKFDPIPQADYYRIKAVFAGIQHGDRVVTPPNDEATVQLRAKLTHEREELLHQLAAKEPLADPKAGKPRRVAVNSRLNRDRFAPVEARFLRFVGVKSNQYEFGLDELEVWTAGPKPENVALASTGTQARSTGDYAGSPEIHRLEFVHDGKYGNSRSWLANSTGPGHVELEFPKPQRIERVEWGRDREGRYQDRTAIQYRIEVSEDGKAWTTVADSTDRQPFGRPVNALLLDVPEHEREKVHKLQTRLEQLDQQLYQVGASRTMYIGNTTAPEVVHLLHRGDVLTPRAEVGPGVLSEIGPRLTIDPKSTERDRRAALADWITSPNNPLTARVMVNRIWQQHFGTGLVDTPSDFGKNGSLPSHPELLDWLAAEFLEKKWSLKHLHKLIVTSRTYQQSGRPQDQGLERDAQCRLLWRFPPRRLEAEVIRDSILATTGLLDLKPGGPGFDLFEPNTNYVRNYVPKQKFGPAEFRRMIYQMKPRMRLDDIFGAFDCPDGGQTAPQRSRSTTALQALNLLNSPFLLQQSDAFAERIRKAVPADPSQQVRQAFRLAFQRPPSEREQQAAEKLIAEHGLSALTRALLNANEFLTLE